MKVATEYIGAAIIFLVTSFVFLLLGYLGYSIFNKRAEYTCREDNNEIVKYDTLNLSSLKINIDQKYYLNYTSDPYHLSMFLPSNASLKKNNILNKFSFGKPGNILTIMHFNDSNYVYHLKIDGQHSFDFNYKYKEKERVLNRSTSLKQLSEIFRYSIKNLKCLDSYYAEYENILKMKLFISLQNRIIGSVDLEFRNYFLSNMVFNYPHINNFQKHQFLKRIKENNFQNKKNRE